jgi:large subunit ribosomal protein L21
VYICPAVRPPSGGLFFCLHFLDVFGIVLITMEFAVINTGGKQYRVSSGDTIKIEKIKGDFKVGDKVVFDKVMLHESGKDTTIGTPFIAAAKVEGTLAEIGRNKTVDVVKYKQKSRYFKKNGHRQPWFKVKIDTIK